MPLNRFPLVSREIVVSDSASWEAMRARIFGEVGAYLTDARVAETWNDPASPKRLRMTIVFELVHPTRRLEAAEAMVIVDRAMGALEEMDAQPSA